MENKDLTPEEVMTYAIRVIIMALNIGVVNGLCDNIKLIVPENIMKYLPAKEEQQE